MSLLTVAGLTKRFGGVVANRDVSFTVRPGELVGVIGPNGAGKSTLFDLITGFARPDGGTVQVDGHDITRLRPDQICRLGVGRTFQKLKPFHEMTALENVMIGAFRRTSDVTAARRAALQALESVGLAERADAHARGLSTGQRKRLELARALATEPRLLLLDEVMEGLTPAEEREAVALLGRVRAAGVTLLLIEHVMSTVRDLSDHVVVMDHGKAIAEGSYAEVSRDPGVVEAYLGTEALA